MRKALVTTCFLLLACLMPLRAEQPAEAPEANVLSLEPVPVNPAPPAAAPPPPTPVPAPAEALDAPPDPAQPVLRTVKAYYVGYADDSFEAVRRFAPVLDIVAGQWLAVDGSGRLKESPDYARNDQVRQIVHDAGKKVYSCVVNAGFSRSVLSRVLSSAARRTAAIDRIIAFVDKKGDDGVDLDFEGIRREHRHGYVAFVRELSEKLHARGKELSIALDVTWGGAPSPGLDYETLSRYADSLMPMTYTFGPGRTPHSPMEYLEKAARLGTRAMDPSKFMIGVGVYGNDYNLHTRRRTHPNAKKLQAILAEHSPEVVFDQQTLTKRLYYKDGKGHGHVVYFDDPETIRAKLTRLAGKYRVSSVGFWRMGQEDPSMWEFIEMASGRKRPDQTAAR